MQTITCISCLFSSPMHPSEKLSIYFETHVKCRRYPPQVDGEASFPKTPKDAWCGEWIPQINTSYFQSRCTL